MKTFGNTTQTPQTEPLNKKQVRMRSGGYGFKLDKLTRLRRFLILGTEGTYYASSKEVTSEFVKVVKKSIKDHGVDAVRLIQEVSSGGIAPKQDYCLYAIAVCLTEKDKELHSATVEAFPHIVRTPTHLYAVAEYLRRLGVPVGNHGTGEAFREYYENTPLDRLAYHVVKYQGRKIVENDPASRWTHADLIRKTHPKMGSETRNSIARYALGYVEDVKKTFKNDSDASIIWGAHNALRTDDVEKAVRLIGRYGLTHEMVSGAVKKDKRVWAALLEKMPPHAMLRNLGVMTSCGTLTGFSDEMQTVVNTLHDHDSLVGHRVHPIDVLKAWHVYAQGKGDKGSLSWTPVSQILAALEDAFYGTFKTVQPTGKRIIYAIDTSGSMTGSYGGNVVGLPWLSPCEAGALMAMIGVRTETRFGVIGFDFKAFPYQISARDNLKHAMAVARHYGGGGTDISQPFKLLMNMDPVDAVVLYTDNESWAGKIHTVQAIKEYRQRKNPDLRVVSVTFTPTKYSVFEDSENTLNVVGLDASAQVLINSFIRKEL